MKKELLIKVCGMREKANLEAIRLLRPDYIGLIFYEKSQHITAAAGAGDGSPDAQSPHCG